MCILRRSVRDFYNSISKSKLKTFDHMTSKTNLKCKFREIILGHIIPELVFQRAVGMMLQLIKYFSHPIGLIGFSFS